MLAADRVTGRASPHVHPRIEAAALAPLLAAAGFVMPVVDVDRVRVRYPSSPRWSRDLRAMGATNMLSRARARALPVAPRRRPPRRRRRRSRRPATEGERIETF